MRAWEDFVFTFECLVAAKNYVRVPFVSYYYRLREDSISHEAVDIKRFTDEVIGVVKSTNDFMSGRKFFFDNPQYKYMLTDFFMQERLNVFAKIFIEPGKYSAGELYEFLYRKIFSQRPQDIAALTSYLFLATNIFKLYAKKLEVSVRN